MDSMSLKSVAYHSIDMITVAEHPSAQTVTYDRADSLLSQASTLFSSVSEADGLADTLIIKRQSTASPDIEAQQFDPKHRPRSYTLLRYKLLDTYRRLFSVVFIGNAIAFIVFMGQGVPLLGLVNAAAANLLICGLARQPLVVNALFKYGCKIPRSAPLRIRMVAAKVFHYGGVHSGAGVASCMWYVAFVGVLTYQHNDSSQPIHTHTAVLVLAWSILLLLCGIIIAAHPALRMKYHNSFEFTHRFSGWLVILLFWSLLLAFSSTQVPSMGIFLVRQPAFWILIVLTMAIIHPWVMLRRVPVQPETLSSHAIRLHLTHTAIDFGQTLSVSHHPLKDWHSFASFPDHFDSPDTSFSMVVSKAGDWTSNIIANPPTYFWKRGVPTYGFAYVTRMFESIILVTTGSGIGPCLSYLALEERQRPRMRVLWQTRAPEKTYGNEIVDLVGRLDPDPVVIDTSLQRKRVDMLPTVLRLYREFGAEAVCVISNPMVTKELVYGCECTGVPAYGPIFDS